MAIIDRESLVRWNRFWKDISKAMVMTDPIAYGWYMVWSIEARGQSQPNARR